MPRCTSSPGTSLSLRARPAIHRSTQTSAMRSYYVYLLASAKRGTLYAGVTNNLVRRIHEHRTDAAEGFTQRYGVHLLVWFECTSSVEAAIQREKNLKNWRREWKISLVEASNPGWCDLYESIL